PKPRAGTSREDDTCNTVSHADPPVARPIAAPDPADRGLLALCASRRGSHLRRLPRAVADRQARRHPGRLWHRQRTEMGIWARTRRRLLTVRRAHRVRRTEPRLQYRSHLADVRGRPRSAVVASAVTRVRTHLVQVKGVASHE